VNGEGQEHHACIVPDRERTSSENGESGSAVMR
jgi:hypothetical protein